MVKCNACNGTYEPVLADGSEYFHVCPPLAPRELRELLDAGTVQLSRADRARLDAAIAEDQKSPAPEGERSRELQVIANLNVPRPGARDENVIPPDPDARDRKRRIKAEGSGTSPVAR